MVEANLQAGPYVLQHGDVWFVDPRAMRGMASSVSAPPRHVCGPNELLAVAFTAEDGDATVLKHGPHEAVSRWADQSRARYTEAGFPAMAEGLSVIAFPPAPEALEELNALIQNGQRLSVFMERLASLPPPHLSAPGL